MLHTSPLSHLGGHYHKVVLKNVQIWEPCLEADCDDWLSPFGAALSSSQAYPIRRKRLYPPSIDAIHVIVQPDGALWAEGCLYLFWCHCVKGLHHSTISNVAGDLSHMMNKLASGERDYNVFRGLPIERPTYFYKSELKIEIARGLIKRKVANRKIANMINFYKWKISDRDFKPDEEMWKAVIKHRRFTDKFGVTQIQEITSTDLPFKVKDSIATGRFLRDGGRLFPIERESQKNLIQVLKELQNTEMLLAHIVSITTGMRMQSTLTLRHHNIVPGIGSESDPRKFDLHYIEIGEGTQVEAKNSKHQFVAIPAWVHNQLHTYINSVRHKERSMKSPITDNNTQYVFLTRTGRPYYVAEADRKFYNYSTETGSAIRQFIKTVMKKLVEQQTPLSYSFHDLRATFGMNLLEDYMKQVKDGKMNQLELLDKLRQRLNHEDINVTLAYLKYREDHPLLAQAQDEFEIHLETLIRTEISKYERQRTSNLLS